MCRFVTLFAAVSLPLMMISTSISASVCDLSCWFLQAQADCHSSSSLTPRDEMAMSMPASMDMGSDQSSTAAGTDAGATASPHSMAMPSQMQMVTERFGNLTKRETGGSSIPSHSKGTSSCIHQICAQVGSTVPFPNPARSQPKSLHPTRMNVSVCGNSRIHFPWLGPGTPPPKTLAVSRLTTTLRI